MFTFDYCVSNSNSFRHVHLILNMNTDARYFAQQSKMIDQARTHFMGNFPDFLPIENAYTHIGMYLGWVIDNNLYSDYFEDESEIQIYRFKRREISCTILSEIWDGYLGNDLLNETGIAFTTNYYQAGKYFEDYNNSVARNYPSMYHVDDSWNNFEMMSKMISQRFEEWKKARRG